MLQTSLSSHQKNFKYLFIILSILLIIIMPLISKDYGQSGDEWLQIEYGQHIYNYFFHGDTQALDYTNKPLQYENMQLYGGLFDFYTELLHRAFPSIPLLFLRHFFNALMGAGMMILTGLTAYRLSGKNWIVGLIALLFIIFSPRIFGESMNNPKDIPFACGFILGVYSWLAMLQDFPKRVGLQALGLALGFGIAFGVRPAGGLLMGAYFVVMTGLYYFIGEGKQKFQASNGLWKKSLMVIVGCFVVGYLIGLSAWPWGLQSPISNPISSLKEMANRGVVIQVFFEGVMRPNNMLPWYYELKWIAMSNPLIVIFCIPLFMLLFLQAKKSYGGFAVFFIVFAAFFPPFYMIYKKSSVYDTWRHLFFIYPFIVVMAAMGINLIGDFIKNEKLKWLPLGIAIIGLLPTIIWTFKVHPNQYVYFNSLIGGIEGANGYYDTDYYQNSALQDAKWIIAHGKKPEGAKKIIVASNMLGFDRYFAKDSSRISNYYLRFEERHKKDWDYYVTYSRFITPEVLQNEKWPPANVAYAVKVDGVTISAVIERKSKACIAANDSLQAKNYPAAIRLYDEYLKTDATDEYLLINYGIAQASIGNIDAAINAIKQATQINSGNPEFYKLLSQLYSVKGDPAQSQQAASQANALIMRQQELMTPMEE